MLQSLCSPWQHDFRDCYCHYWASNHPDVVYGEIYPGELTGGAPELPNRADVMLDWMRADRSRAMEAGAFDTFSKNRPYQLDHFQINSAWQNLSIVIGDTEIGGPYVPENVESANPYASPEELAAALRDELAPLELTLAIEYLYARFSLLSPSEASQTQWANLADDVTFARHYLILVAVSEMQHVRWANELLWNLYDIGLIGSYEPIFEIAKSVPRRNGNTAPQLRRLENDVLEDFIAVEHPSGLISGKYAQVIATLRQTKIYGPHLVELALRIANDGMQHERWFLDMKAAFKAYEGVQPPYPYLREIRVGTKAETSEALDKLTAIIDDLEVAYADGARGDFAGTGQKIADARVAMNDLVGIGEKLAAQKIGIPFLTRWQTSS